MAITEQQEKAGRAFFGDELFERIVAMGEAKTKALEDAGVGYKDLDRALDLIGSDIKDLSKEEAAVIRRAVEFLLELLGESYPQPKVEAKSIMDAVFTSEAEPDGSTFLEKTLSPVGAHHTAVKTAEKEAEAEAARVRLAEALGGFFDDDSHVDVPRDDGGGVSMAAHVFRGRKVA